MKRIICLGALLLGLVWILAPLPVVAEDWPIKEFLVLKENPSGMTANDVEVARLQYKAGLKPKSYYLAVKEIYEQQQLDQQNAIEVSDAVVSEIERWLKTVAQEYEAMGFIQPHYTDIDSSIFDNNQAYKVYVYPFSDGGPAAMLSRCENQGALYMKVDSNRNVKNGKLTGKAYQDLAHELFHAVQGSYDVFHKNGCSGAWITEGTAEAVGIEMARKLYPKVKPLAVCQIGIRRYSEKLYVPKRKTLKGQCGYGSYLTQSFWQFLGEYSTRKGFIATEEFTEPDFRYLHNFFNTTHAMGTRSKEYVWLDKVLRQVKRYGKHQFGISLHTAYSRFVGSFASYWRPRRISLYPGSDGDGTEEKWVEKFIFGKCEELTVSKDASIFQVVTIEPVAARCIKVNFNFSGRVGLTFYASGENESIALESLAISTNGGEKIIRRHPAEQVADKIGKFPAISAQAGTPQYFIVSNVRRNDPGNTEVIAPLITIVPEFSTATMAKEKKEPDSTEDQTEKEERETAGESRSWKGKVWQNKRRPCTRPFEASPCGPTTDIGLGLVPDTTHLFDALSQPSMSGERKFRLFDDVVQEGPEAFVSDLLDDTIAIHQQDGGAVDIVIPQIQPGFTGTISNAHITVAQAIDAKGSYRALGPWVGSCRDGYWPSTGTVTIKEFTKYIMRGTFSAQLVDTKGLKSCQSGSVSKSDSGSFSITEIDWNLGFESPELDDDAVIDDTVDDINATIPGLMSDELVERAKEHARKKRQEREQAKQEKAKGTGGVSKQCNCDCQMEPTYCDANPNTTCCQYCDSLFKICQDKLQSHSVPLTAEDQAKEDAEIKAMRERYEAYVDSLGLPNEAIKQQVMEVFDQLETVNDKKMFMMSIP